MQRGVLCKNGKSVEESSHIIEQDLQFINYYRLSAYWHPFLSKNTNEQENKFLPNTYWETIRSFYMFDRRLRSIIFDAISRIEIALRTQIAHYWAKSTKCDNPQSDSKYYKKKFTRSKNIKTDKSSPLGDFLDTVDKYYDRSKEEFATHHKEHYGILHAKDLPVWVFVEFTTFGNLASLLSRGLTNDIVKQIANNFNISNTAFFVSCINLLNEARNVCAHQGRVWNKVWISTKKDNILKASDTFLLGSYMTNDERKTNDCHNIKQRPLVKDARCTAAILSVCYLLLKTAAPGSKWKNRLMNLLSNEDTPAPDMHKHLGFEYSDWFSHPLWQ